MVDWRDRAQTDGEQQPADRPPRAQGARAGRLAALAIAGIAALAPLAHAQLIRSPEAVPSGQPIPKDFKTWSLFLVCNPAWLGDGAAAKARMTTLHGTFLGFGHSLGTRNAAVWFTTANGPAAEYDGDRAGDFCGTYGLESNRSPYVVVTSDYPSPVGAPGEYVAISLTGLDEDNVSAVLGKMADRIRSSHLDKDQMTSDRYWRGWIQVLEDTAATAGHVAKGLTFSIDTKVVKASFDGKALSE
jgi:hypothetical protein